MSQYLIVFSFAVVSGSLSSATIDQNDYHSVPVDLSLRKLHAKELVGKALWVKTTLGRQTASETREAVHNIISRSLSRQDKALTDRTTKAILSASLNAGMDPLFLLAMMKTESRFNPRVVGRHGEIGLMQIRPQTAKWIANRLRIPWHGVQALHDPVYNIRLGVAYLSYLRQSFGPDSAAYVAAYNMGAANVRRLRRSAINPKIYASKVLLNYQGYYVALSLQTTLVTTVSWAY